MNTVFVVLGAGPVDEGASKVFGVFTSLDLVKATVRETWSTHPTIKAKVRPLVDNKWIVVDTATDNVLMVVQEVALEDTVGHL